MWARLCRLWGRSHELCALYMYFWSSAWLVSWGAAACDGVLVKQRRKLKERLREQDRAPRDRSDRQCGTMAVLPSILGTRVPFCNVLYVRAAHFAF